MELLSKWKDDVTPAEAKLVRIFAVMNVQGAIILSLTLTLFSDVFFSFLLDKIKSNPLSMCSK